jgi:hypothetical protein
MPHGVVLAFLVTWSTFSFKSVDLFITPCCPQKYRGSCLGLGNAGESTAGRSLIGVISFPQRGHFKTRPDLPGTSLRSYLQTIDS